jgi:hypothetical protein
MADSLPFARATPALDRLREEIDEMFARAHIPNEDAAGFLHVNEERNLVK